jgi:tRNA1Val (adenine37-N6)-methyltransferase
MSKDYFQFKKFNVYHHKSSMKVGTDAVLLACLSPLENSEDILEIGCGSGIISLIAAQRSLANITAIDIHEDSVLQATENFKNSPWSGRINCHHISIQEFSKKEDRKYDAIISNPPFFIDSLKSPDENRNLARHNHHLSQLELLQSARQLLKPKGILSLILPLTEGEEMIQKAIEEGFYLISRLNILPKPSKKANRIVIELSLREKENQKKQLIIREENNEYTNAYKELTKDFYLAL